MTAAERILEKNLVTAGLSSAEWDAFSAGIKDRVFWSARIEKVRYLETARNGIADMLSNARNKDGALTSRAQVVSEIMRAARSLGIGTGGGGLADPASDARAAVIVDTNAGLAAGWADYARGNSYGARAAFPAQELVRVEAREHQRDWAAIWNGNGGAFYGGRMAALKGDPVWIAISRFGLPYPPFDYNSGMGVRDVSHGEAVEIGLIEEEYMPPENSPIEDFNAGLEADMMFSGPDDPGWLYLKDVFGDQVNYQNGKVKWNSDVMLDAFRAVISGDNTAARLIRNIARLTDATRLPLPPEAMEVMRRYA